MAAEMTGIVQGGVIRLDDDVSPLDGQRVRVRIEAIGADEQTQLSAAENERLLREWVARGPQGPLEVEDSWPDSEN